MRNSAASSPLQKKTSGAIDRICSMNTSTPKSVRGPVDEASMLTGMPSCRAVVIADRAVAPSGSTISE
jgi:hypothetical protein